MPKKTKTTGPVSKFEMPNLDEELFFELFDILHDGCMGGNYSATARVLDIAIPTARRWSREAPKGKWMNHILQQAITEVYHSMVHSTHKKIRKRAQNVNAALSRSSLHSLKEYIDYNEANNSDVVRELLVAINEAPQQQLTTDQLKLPGYLGAFNQRLVRQAATRLQLVTETTGFGEDKVTTYRMPKPTDLT